MAIETEKWFSDPGDLPERTISEMAKGLAKAGCSVAILDIRLEKAEAVSNDLKIEGIE